MTFWTRTVPGMFLAFLIAIPLLGAASGGKEATREDFREISTAGADRLKLAVGAGFLHVIGEDSRNEIRMEAKITAMGRDRQMAEEILEEVEIRETRRGSTLTLKTRGPDELKRGGFRVDISIWIPSGMAKPDFRRGRAAKRAGQHAPRGICETRCPISRTPPTRPISINPAR